MAIILTSLSEVSYTAVVWVVTQRSSPLKAAYTQTTFLSLCVKSDRDRGRFSQVRFLAVDLDDFCLNGQ